MHIHFSQKYHNLRVLMLRINAAKGYQICYLSAHIDYTDWVMLLIKVSRPKLRNFLSGPRAVSKYFLKGIEWKLLFFKP